MATVSETIAAAIPAADDRGRPAAVPEEARAHARMRARDYRSLSVWGKIKDLLAAPLGDLMFVYRSLAAKMPTLRMAWAQRMPDRGRVPGNNAVLYGGWVFYNHTLGLAFPLLGHAGAGLLTGIVWAGMHPARATLTTTITTAIAAVILN